MNSEFNELALSRARYYTKGSPVQFVQVELLRMEDTGSMVVTLTFKNIAPNQILTDFTAHFCCKDAQGLAVMEDDFTYSGLQVQEGECFGSDEAVFVSAVPLSSVEVRCKRAAYASGRVHDLTQCKAVPLAALRPMPQNIVQAVNTALETDVANYVPANTPDGWQCTCGAFNYNVGRGIAMCSECGTDKAALYNAVREAANAGRAPQSHTNCANAEGAFLPVTEPAAPCSAAPQAAAATTAYDKSAVSTAQAEGNPYGKYFDDSKTMVMNAAAPDAQKSKGVSIMKNTTADWILKYVPFITAGASAGYVLVLLLIHALIT